LKEILDSVALQEDFGNRILNSVQETTTRILQADAKTKLELIHLRVFVPSKRPSQRHTWGFFSVEKLEDAKDGAVNNERTIEIYLYLEGNRIPMDENK
jgi:hypothetical protein